MPCGVMVALRILVPSVRVRVLPRQQRANHPYGGLLFFFLSPPEIGGQRIFWDSGYFRLAGACHEYSVASLNMKNFTSPTPRNCVRKALIFALNDSAEALVSLSSK